uniref:putative E3 ubiquitin-protein ligase RF298 n=1 Tax=Erigeron canadensis TaxID=72917 RepID=UPI001CB9B5E7|nr:putative E3 ubiquitin-protein ligase RF298 [Erigeron canadensis]
MKASLDMPKGDMEAQACHSGWDSKTVTELAELLSDVLHTCFNNAIKRIVESGYSKEVAETMVLRCGPFYGIKDMVSSIVDRCLDCLKNTECHDPTFYMFDDIDRMVEYMMLEMVTILLEIKPSLSVHEAMWTLLICDLNVIDATDADLDLQKFSVGGLKAVQEEGTSAKIEPEAPSESEFRDQETIASSVGHLASSSGKINKDNCQCCKNCPPGHKRDGSRRKLLQFEKPYKGQRSKKALKAELASWRVLTTRKRSTSGPSSVNMIDSSLPLKETTETPKVTPKSETVPPNHKTAEYYLAGIPYDELKGEHVPQDDKDKMILAAVGQLRSLQKDLKSWDDWANLKVMQVAKRLSQDRPELNKLKFEKQEAERLKKDKQAMEENTIKKLAEVTASLNATNYNTEMASAAIVRLESEKAVLKEEKEKAENRSSNETKNLEEALRKEKEALKKSESYGAENNLFEEELKSLKRKAGPMQGDLEKAKRLFKDTETRLANEQRETAKFLHQAVSIRNERKHLDSLAKAKRKMDAQKAEKDIKKFESDLKMIQYEIAEFKLEAETQKIAAMRKGMSWQPSEGTSLPEVSTESTYAKTSLQKDRECVMCLTHEMTIVFVPCGHQVLCAECNVIHEKKGMLECPSCRTPIQKRIASRFAKC